MEYLEWLAAQYNEVLGREANAAWLKTQLVIQSMARKSDNLRVYILSRRSIPSQMEDICVDVTATYRACAKSDRYDINLATGANPSVQARIATQRATAEALLQAVLTVELQNAAQLRKVAFVCDGGTHRSLACGCLLLSLAYPRAAIIPGTPRTITDSVKWLLRERPALGAHPHLPLS